jgi:hypothetical protein
MLPVIAKKANIMPNDMTNTSNNIVIVHISVDVDASSGGMAGTEICGEVLGIGAGSGMLLSSIDQCWLSLWLPSMF